MDAHSHKASPPPPQHTHTQALSPHANHYIKYMRSIRVQTLVLCMVSFCSTVFVPQCPTSTV